MKKYAKLWIVPLLLAGLSLGAKNLARSCWSCLVHFKAPQFTVEPGDHGDLMNRVVIVVVDGLRIDAFNKMKFVSSLKEKGAYFTLKTGQPSLSLPCGAVISTGAWQDVTGVTTNWFKGPVRQDSLFSLAKDAGLTSAIVGEEGWDKLFGDKATKVFARKWEDADISFDEQTLEKALEFLSENPLLLVHFVDVDSAGHDFGGASPEYQKSADHIDTLIERLHQNLPEDAALIITSDHGQLDSGGHGGWEEVVTHVPLLISGRTIKPGDYGKAEQTDIAATVTALAGLPMPPYSQGRILAEALELGAQQARLKELLVEQKETFTRAYFKAIGADIDKIRGEIKPTPSEGAEHYWSRVLTKGKEKRIQADRLRNLPLFFVVLLLPLLAFWSFKRKFKLSYKLPFLLSLLFFVIDYGIFFASGKSISLSSINDEDLLQRFFNEVMIYTAVSALLVIITLAFLDRRKERFEAIKSSVILVAFIAFLIVLEIDISLLYSGPLITWYLPNMFLDFKYYLDLMSLISLGLVSVILPLIAMIAHRLWERLKL